MVPSDARVFMLDVGKHAGLVGRKLGFIAVLILLAAALFQLLWWQTSLDSKYPDSALVCALTFAGVIGGMSLVIWMMLWGMFSSYRLLLGPGFVAVDSGGRFRQQVNRDEVEGIADLAVGLVLVRRRGLAFRIPSSLNGYEAVRAELLGWAPLVPSEGPGSRPWIGLIAKLLIAFGSLLVAFLFVMLLAVVNVLVKVVTG
jgi:hypothetical protein